jgi:hypothetical protein
VGLEQTPNLAWVLRQPFIPRLTEPGQPLPDLLVSHLLTSREVGQKPLTAIWGACGSGKTALAWEVFRKNKQIRDAFPDKPLWVTLGNNPLDFCGDD